MLFGKFLERRRLRRIREDRAHSLYISVVKQARQPVFFTDIGVPDTQEGRYDLIVLHAWVLMRRLGTMQEANRAEAKELGQTTFDVMFADLDRNLRELGITDSGIGKRIKKLAEAFYGRIFAYDQALAQDDDAFKAALNRNLFRDVQVSDAQLSRMVAYTKGQMAALEQAQDADFLEGRVNFEPAEKWL